MNEFLKMVIPQIAVLVPLVVAIVAWYLNQHGKLEWEKRLQKEDRYRAFLESISGFYIESQDKGKKEKFIQEMRLALLYCPDDVIRAGNAFLDTVATGKESSDGKKERALAEFALVLRRDLHGKTKLTIEDWRNWGST